MLNKTILLKCLPYDDICKVAKIVYDKYKKQTDVDYINVVKSIPKTQTPDQSDDNAVDLILQSLKESENGMPCIIDKNTANVQLVGNKQYIVIQDFD